LNKDMSTKKQIEDTNFLAIISAVLIVVFAITMYLTKVYSSEALDYERDLSNLKRQSQSTEVENIEKDLTNTDLTNLDQELADIEKELDSAELE